MQGVVIRVRTEGGPEAAALSKSIRGIGESAGEAGKQTSAGTSEIRRALADITRASDDLRKSNALRELGLSIEQLRARNPEQALTLIRVALEQIPSSAERARLATELLGGAGRKLADDIGRTTPAIGQFNSMLAAVTPTAVIAVAAAAGVAVLGLGASAISAAADLKRMSDRTGVSVEDLSVFRHAAGLVGADVNDVALAFRWMEKHVDDAVHGNKLAIRNFQELGVSIQDLKTKSPKDLFLEVANGLDNMKDKGEAAAKAQEVLGRSGSQMLPLMKLLAHDGYNQVAQEALKLGVVISTQTAQDAFEFEKSMFRVKEAVLGVGFGIVRELLPVIDMLLRRFQDLTGLAPKIVFDFVGFFNPLNQLILTFKALAVVIDSVVTGLEMIGRAATSGWKFGSGLLKAAGGDYAGGMTDMASAGTEWDKTKNAPGLFWQRTSQTMLPKEYYGPTYTGPASPGDRTPPPTTDPNLARREQEALQVAKDQFAVASSQVSVAAALDDVEKKRLEHATKLLEIQQQYDRSIKGISNKFDSKTRAGLTEIFGEIRDQKISQEAIAYEQAMAKVLVEDQQHLDALNQAAEAAQKNLSITQTLAQAEALHRQGIATTAQAEQEAALRRMAALEDYNQKREKLEFDARQQIEKWNVDAAEALRKISTGAGTAGDVEVLRRWAEQVNAATAKVNADTTTARVQLDQQLLDIDLAMEDAKRQALANARYSDDTQTLMAAQQLAEKLARLTGNPIYKAISQNLGAAIKDANDEADRVATKWKNTAQEMGNAVTGVFETLANGGKLSDAFRAIGQAAARLLSQSLGDALKGYLDNLANLAAGRPGKIWQNGQLVDGPMPTTDQTRSAQMKLTGFQIGSSALGLYEAGQSGVGKGANALSGATSGAAIGAQLGGGYGAVIGAVVGAVAGLLTGADKQKDYKFGIPNIFNGTAEIANSVNLTKGEKDALTAKLQTVFTDTWNGFVNIMLKLPGAQSPSLGKYVPPGKISSLDPFQENPSAHWAEHFQEYLANTLPAEIAQYFKGGMEKAFVSNGMTSDAFQRFWTEAETMDPSKRMQFWADLADGLASFTEAQDRFDHVKTALSSPDSLAAAQLNDKGWQHQYGDSDFVTKLKATAGGVFDIARQMVNLTGPDQVAAWKQLGASVGDVTKSLVDYVNQIAQTIRNLRQSFHDAELQHDLARETDPNAKARLLEAEYNSVVDKIQHAKQLGLTAQEVEQLTNKGIGLLNNIYDLDPSKEADAWWHQQMNILQKVSEDSLTTLAKEAQSAVQQLLDELKPFKDWFLGLPVDIGAAMKLLEGPNGAFQGFADALNDLAKKLKEFDPYKPVPVPKDPPPVKTRDPHDPRNPIDANQSVAIHVTVNMNGTSIGADDLVAAAQEGTINALRRYPQLVEPSYSFYGGGGG